MPTKAQRKAFMAKAKAKKEAQVKEKERQQLIIEQFANNDLYWIKILSLCRKFGHQGPKWLLRCRLINKASNKAIFKMPDRTWWYWYRVPHNPLIRSMRLKRNMFMVNLNPKIDFIQFLNFPGSRKKTPKHLKEKYGPHLRSWTRIKEKIEKTGEFPRNIKGATAERSKNTLKEKLIKRNYWLKKNNREKNKETKIKF